jgi:hypothetical protein
MWEPPGPSAIGVGLTEQNSTSRPDPSDRVCANPWEAMLLE